MFWPHRCSVGVILVLRLMITYLTRARRYGTLPLIAKNGLQIYAIVPSHATLIMHNRLQVESLKPALTEIRRWSDACDMRDFLYSVDDCELSRTALWNLRFKPHEYNSCGCSAMLASLR